MKFIQVDPGILDDGHALSKGHAGVDDKYVKIITRWVRNYLCKPHSKLGREGPVCPFTAPAVRLGQIWIAVAPNSHDTVDSVVQISLEAKAFFQNAPEDPSQSKYYKAAMILFPHLNTHSGHAVVESAQQRLKRTFVADGLMFGQFYQGCQEPGLANPEFRPLFSPIPLLAIRYMVPADIAFLRGDPQLMEYYNYYTREENVALDKHLAS